ncbi:DNA replication protein psf2 [Didymosphaeria variabile]|uniref:DNA replication complex GINS protein PSF2 n=1 Tax=Didymosphaeria variabile TaxID=1932322 RepID=A0A9W9CEC2_9PLEO|nr:DNA replication protein psf2 [Didymosphaeria variabile]KAJ4357654.1 DNA replication protein psf2 [Didymosphaeria variabile]
MALPLPPGLTPPEIAFICEMELVTIIPRQRLEGLELLGGPLKPLNPPQRASLPLWLALLLKRQRRANIIPPPWLSPDSLAAILQFETESSPDAFSPPPRLPPPPSSTTIPLSSPFLPSSTADAPADALPYHWLELGSMLLEAAPDDFDDADEVRKLLRGLREARMAKLRQGVEVLDAGGGFKMNGVGGMELGEARSFITGVVDGLRKIGKSREEARRERERENGYSPSQNYEDDEMDMR